LILRKWAGSEFVSIQRKSWRGEQQPISDEEFGFEKLSWLISYKTATFQSNKKLHSIFRGWGRECVRLAVCCGDRE
jgi:hypothetical protein